MKFSTSEHRPLHMFLDDGWYFITASTLNHVSIFRTEDHLQLWKDAFFALSDKFDMAICAWVILANHYHILIQCRQGRDLSKFIGQLHGRTSRQVNILDHTPGRQVWYSYWDRCLRTESDFWSRFNYIHSNPVKHGDAEKAEDWAFSSYRIHQEREGKEWLAKLWMEYPTDALLPGDPR